MILSQWVRNIQDIWKTYGIFILMNFRKPLIWIFIFAFASFFLFSEINSFVHGLDKLKEDSYAQNKINLDTILDLQKQNTQLIAMQLANDEVVQQAYIQDSQEMMIRHIEPFWKKVKQKDLIYEIHFFKPPATSFVNFSNFNSIGKDVSSVRKDISWITSSFQNSSHLMMCKTYAGVRATYPIFDKKGQMLGGLSLGKKVDWIPSILKKTTKKDAFLTYTDASTQSLAKQYYDSFLDDKEKIDGYILADKTMDISSELVNSMDFSVETQDVEIEGKPYFLNVFPLFDFEQNVMAYVTVLNDLEPFYAQFYIRMGKNMLFLILLLVLLYLLVRQDRHKYLKRVSSIQALTHAYRKKDFSHIDEDEKGDLCQIKSSDEIVRLEKDVIAMGVTLRGYYNNLEEEVEKKATQLQESNARLRYQLYTDDLTELPNRNAFFRDLKETVMPQVAILNVNRFKMVNDVYGVDVGNALLIDLSKEISQKYHSGKIYHLGADEFVFLGGSSIDNENFEKQIVNLLEMIEKHLFIVGEERIELDISISAGISFEREHAVESADIALNRAKQMHLGHVVYDSERGLKKLHNNNIKLMKKIKDALINGDMQVYYQAIVDETGLVRKYEALVRMIDGDIVLTPYHFLEIAKKSKYYQAITHTVIEQSFENFKDRDMAFSININADDILNKETVDFILDSLSSYTDASRVVFEIVESESIDKFDSVQKFISQVKGMGAKVAIDDFGSGYSNFSYLLELRPDYLKIDGSLIKNIDTDTNAYHIVKTIVQFAKTLQIKTIAEFIHSKEVFEVVKSLGVDEFQGYYFAEPSKEIE